MAEWSRVVNTTLTQYVRGEEIQILRNRKWLALLREKGRISFNHSGDKINWRVRYKRAPLVGYADGDTLTFSRRDRWKQAELDWRGYSITDSMTKKERLMNKSTEQIINIYSQLGPSLVDDLDDQFGDELYIDGYASGNGKRLCGIESMMGNSGGVSAGYVAGPSDTYAGLSTALGNFGGAWSVNGSSQVEWPSGSGDSHYDFWSPLIVDYTDTAWSASTKTWPNTCKEALRYGIIKSKKNKTKKGMLDMVMLNDELYRQFVASFDAQQQIQVNRGMGDSLLVKLGFTDVVNWEGVDHTYEYGLPSGVGYGINTMQMELMSLQAQLFVVEGPDYDIATKSYRTSVDFMGNAKFNPRYFVKFAGVT